MTDFFLHIVDDLKRIRSTKKDLRSFSFVVGGGLFALGVVMLLRQKPIGSYLAETGAVLVVLGLLIPVVLKPLQKIWMALAIFLGYIMTPVVMGIVFYLILTPMGLVYRLTRKRPHATADSYWIRRGHAAADQKNLEKQF